MINNKLSKRFLTIYFSQKWSPRDVLKYSYSKRSILGNMLTAISLIKDTATKTDGAKTTQKFLVNWPIILYHFSGTDK